MKKLLTVIVSTCLVILAMSCSGRDSDPMVPGVENQNMSGGKSVQNDGGSAVLWGYWDIYLNPGSGSVEIVPLRSVMFTCNVNQFVDSRPGLLKFKLGDIEVQPDFMDIPVDVGLEHPFPGLDTYTGFDVLGVFMGSGSETGPDGYEYSGSEDCRVLNPDGYTRWFNYSEFNKSTLPLLGYTPGKLGSPGFVPSAILNEYKYFADGLSVEADPFSFLENNSIDRGKFSPGSINWRHYDVRFPSSVGVRFQYAVVAHWEEHANYPNAPQGLDDFPIEANSDEAVVCKIENADSTAWYKDGEFGGQVILDVSPWDWSAETSTVMEEYVIRCYSDAWTGPMEAEMVPFEYGDFWFTYRAEIDVESLQSNEPLHVWIEVAYPEMDYSNKFGVPNSAEGELSGYFVREIPVLDEIPPHLRPIYVLSPNGGESWAVGTEHYIVWTSYNVTANVMIEYSKDNFVSDINLISADELNDGSYQWMIPDDITSTAKVRITTMDGLHSDDSDNFFNIIGSTAPWLEVISPNGFEQWMVGSTHNVSWTSGNINGLVNVEYSMDDFNLDINSIELYTPNDGSLQWLIPNKVSNTVKVRVSLASDPSIYDVSDLYFSITPESYGTFTPVPGLEHKPLDNAWEPDQDAQPVDITLYNQLGSSTAQTCRQTGNWPSLGINFNKWNDGYTGSLGGWAYNVPGGKGYRNPGIHKFDALLSGFYLFVTNAEHHAVTYPNPGCSDPTLGAFSANYNYNGSFMNNDLGLHGDKAANYTQPDPNELPWFWSVDFSSGVRDGLSDTDAYQLVTFYPSQIAGHEHDGNIYFGRWQQPYISAVDLVGAPVSIYSGGNGLISDSNPDIMALGADDDSGLVLFGEEDTTSMWVLDSLGKVTSVLVAWESGDVKYWGTSSQLTYDHFGNRTPIDIEVLPAKYADNDIFGSNWIAVLFDNGNNSWSVGVWEAVYEGNSNFAEAIKFVTYHQIGITDPETGKPQCLDIDNDDFEIHVLFKLGSTVKISVFTFDPGI